MQSQEQPTHPMRTVPQVQSAEVGVVADKSSITMSYVIYEELGVIAVFLGKEWIVGSMETDRNWFPRLLFITVTVKNGLLLVMGDWGEESQVKRVQCVLWEKRGDVQYV